MIFRLAEHHRRPQRSSKFEHGRLPKFDRWSLLVLICSTHATLAHFDISSLYNCHHTFANNTPADAPFSPTLSRPSQTQSAAAKLQHYLVIGIGRRASSLASWNRLLHARSRLSMPVDPPTCRYHDTGMLCLYICILLLLNVANNGPFCSLFHPAPP